MRTEIRGHTPASDEPRQNGFCSGVYGNGNKDSLPAADAAMVFPMTANAPKLKAKPRATRPLPPLELSVVDTHPHETNFRK